MKEKQKEKRKQKNSHGTKLHKKPFKSIKVALVYDRVNKWGGAERILLALHKIFPSAPLYTSVFHAKQAKWAKVFTVKTSFLQKVPFAKSHHQFFSPLMQLAFRSFRFDAFDIVISITSESAKAVKIRGNVKHICLCLTPTRYLWSGYEEYFPNTVMRKFTKPLISALRFLDKKTAQNPSAYIAISQEVQSRIKKYYDRESRVIYPPVMLNATDKKKIFDTRYKILEKKKHKYQISNIKYPQDYFLVVSRLSRFTTYKRIDIAVKAATKLGLPLIVIGEGNQKYFKKYAGPTIKFIHNVNDRELQQYYKYAKALIFPGNEDFGLVMVEAQLFGTPVIAYKAGGALEIIKKGKTGEFFSKQTVDSLADVLKNFDRSRYNSQSCKENARRFSFSHFQKSLQEYILNTL